MKIAVGILSCSLTLGLTSAALADAVVISDAQWIPYSNVYLQASNQGFPLSPTPNGPGTFTASGSDSGGSISATLTGSGQPGPAVSASATGVGNNFESLASIEYTLYYYVDIVGPAGPVTVGVHSTGIATAFSENPLYTGTGSASVQIFTSDGSIFDRALAQSQLARPSESFNLSTTVQENANTEFEVILDVDVSVMTSSGTASGYGFVDPYFFIPISDPDAGDYTILTSAGIGNSPVSGVPEPSTWALMLIGFAGIGFAGYCRAAYRPLRAIG